jgi:hypothetical protein
MGRTIPSFRIALDLEKRDWKPFCVVVLGGPDAYLMYDCAFTIIIILLLSFIQYDYSRLSVLYQSLDLLLLFLH